MSRAFQSTSSALIELEAELDTIGGMSIVIQGGLFKNNLVDVANQVRHLRGVFPVAQIVVSVSSSNVLWWDESKSAIVQPTAERLNDTVLVDALRIVFDGTEVVLARGALPLPAIKSDIRGQNNNFNLQLAAAQAGLKSARGKYTLRVRNDLCFTDRSFLRHYAERVNIARIKPVFSQRILVSSIFSLNPYTIERMPFHFSDWFHFGITSDIVQLWQVEPIHYAEATYFRTRPHPEYSNSFERLVYTRFAVEQQLYFSFYKHKLNLESMNHFNDIRHRDLSMQIILDDFILIHPLSCHILFEKYEHAYSSNITNLGCISSKEWDLLANNREIDPHKFFESKARSAERFIALEDASRTLRTSFRRATCILKKRVVRTWKSLLLSLVRLAKLSK